MNFLYNVNKLNEREKIRYSNNYYFDDPDKEQAHKK